MSRRMLTLSVAVTIAIFAGCAPVRVVPAFGGVDRIAYTPDGSGLLVTEGALSLLDAATGNPRQQSLVPVPKFQVRDFAFSPDGKRLHVFGGTYLHTRGAPQEEGFIVTLATDLTGEPERLTTRAIRQDMCGAISPDGKQLVTGGTSDQTKSIVVVDLARKEVVKTFDAHFAPTPHDKTRTPVPHDLYAARFSPDGKLLATSGGNHRVELWDAADEFKKVGEFAGHTHGVMRIEFTPDGKTLVSVSWDGTARIWNVSEKNEQHQLKLKNNSHTEAVDVAISPDGKMLATADNSEAKIWDLTTGKEIRTLATKLPGPSCVAFSPDGKHLAVGFADRRNRNAPSGGVEQFVVETGLPRALTTK